MRDKRNDNNRDNRDSKKDTEEKTMTYYKVLGVDENASLQEIKKNFRNLVATFHPDNKKTGDASIFALVARANECLTDTNKRAEYDMSIKIERASKKAMYAQQRKEFDDFIKAQEDENTVENKKKAENKFKLEYSEKDNKVGFNRALFEQEKIKPLQEDEISSRIDSLRMTREQEEIEFTPKKMFDGEFNHEKFHAMYEKKYKNSHDLVKSSGNPSAFNNEASSAFDPSTDYDAMFDDGDANTSMFSSLNIFGNSVDITDDDLNDVRVNVKSEYSRYNEEKGKSYQTELEKKLKERELEDSIYEDRKFKDFDTDPNMGGYGFLKNAGLTGKELEFEYDENDNQVAAKLLQHRRTKDFSTRNKK
jgi:curved DNA-binding protein CbpA